MRSELRIIPMTKEEYEKALDKYLGDDQEARETIWDFTMQDFSEAYISAMEINTQGCIYQAVLVDRHGESIDNRLYELPEKFVNDLPENWF